MKLVFDGFLTQEEASQYARHLCHSNILISTNAFSRQWKPVAFKNPPRFSNKPSRLFYGEDLMGSAQTGTGKTAAFVLPILHQLLQRKPTKKSIGPRCLVVAPTRELAQQVEKDVTAFSKFIKCPQGSLVEAWLMALRFKCSNVRSMS